MRRPAAVVVLVIFSLATACATAAPTPTRTPQARPTPVEVLATKPEHLEGIWLDGEAKQYELWAADGTIRGGYSVEDLDTESSFIGEFWFEDGIYYEEGAA